MASRTTTLTLLVALGAMTGPDRRLQARAPDLVDGRFGHQVKETAHRVRARVFGLVAETVVTVSLRSTSGGPEEGILTVRTPPRAEVTDLEVKVGTRWARGALLDAKAVRTAIQDTDGLPRRADPAWLEQTGPDRYRLRVYPVPPRGTVTVRYRYLHPVTLRWGHRVFVYPRRGRERNLASASVQIEDHSPFRSGVRRYRLRVPAKTTLERVLPDPPIPSQTPVRTTLFAAPAPQGGVGRSLLLIQGNPRATRRHWGTDVIFLVDDSYSMWRDYRDTAAAVVRSVLRELGRRTRFALVAFHQRATVLTRLGSVTAARISAALRKHRRLAQANGTSLQAGLRQAYRLLGRRRSARRRLVVVLTDGLLPERESTDAVWPNAPRGTELLVLNGRPQLGVTRRLGTGPLASLARRQGGLAYAFDPFPLEDGTSCGDRASHRAVGNLAASLARAGRLTNLRLRIDNTPVSLPHPDLTLLGGHLVVHRTPGGTARQAVLGFGWWGKRRRLSIAARRMPRAWNRFLGPLFDRSRNGAVSPKRSLVVVHPGDAFGRDRLRFAQRWGGRFFRRMAPVGALDLPVGPFHRNGDVVRRPAASRSKAAPGRLTKKIVRRLLQVQYIRRATRCYQATGPRFKKGRAVLYMDLTRGEVADAWVAHSTLHNATLHRCLVAAARKLRVARSWADDTLYRVSYPMRFRPADQSVSELRGWRPPRRRRLPNPLRGLR